MVAIQSVLIVLVVVDGPEAYPNTNPNSTIRRLIVLQILHYDTGNGTDPWADRPT